MSKKKYDPIKGMQRQIGLQAMEGIGYQIPFHIAGATPGAGAGIAAQVATTGSALAGQASLVHGAVNVMKTAELFDIKNPRHRRRRR